MGENNRQKISMIIIQTICLNRIALCEGKYGTCSAEVGALTPSFRKTSYSGQTNAKILTLTFNVST